MSEKKLKTERIMSEKCLKTEILAGNQVNIVIQTIMWLKNK
jgi:hypothetical protein